MTALLRPAPWTRNAACATELTPDAWDRCTPEARAVCATCPVRTRCATEALDNAIPDGLWGGLDPDDRTAVADHFGYDRPGLPRHGTRARYVHRTQPCRRTCCREAHRRWADERRAAGAWATPDTARPTLVA